jgi:formate hydrogenlyase subunit 6/NADH:ubiquinone oxidoreductase subunit I
MGVASYLKDIKDTMSSTFEGMSITLSHLARKPMTIQYPDKIPVPIQETLPHRYRGILEVDLDIHRLPACERDCPITCIPSARDGQGN